MHNMPLPILSFDKKQAISQRVSECLKAFRSAGLSLDTPLLKFDLNGKLAGEVNAPRNEIRFNPLILAENPTRYLQVEVANLVALLATHKKHGLRIHPQGPEWRAMLATLGVHAPALGRAPQASAAPKLATYRCRCKAHLLPGHSTPTRPRCATCGEVLQRMEQADSRAPCAPEAPRSLGASAPGEALVTRARALAQSLNMPLPPDALRTVAACQAFLTRHAPVQPSTRPSARQLELAETFAGILKTAPPRAALSDRDVMSAWLAEQSRHIAANPR